MAQPIFLRGARQLLTLRGSAGLRCGPALANLEVVEDGSLLIRDGIIAQIGSTRRLENLKDVKGAVELPVHGIAMPGFVDPAIRVYATAHRANPSRIHASNFYDSSLALVRSATQHGTLHAQLRTSTRGGNVRAHLSALRQISGLATRTGGLTRAWCLDGDDVAGAAASMPALVQRKLAHRVEISSAIQAEMAAALCDAAHQEHLGVNFWLRSIDDGLHPAFSRGAPRMVLAESALHDADCALLGEHAVPVALMPLRCLVEDVYQDTAQRLLAHNCALALASGYDEAESPVFNMQLAVALAVRKLGLSTEQAISAATVNAAYAAGVGHATGTLEAGKRADLLVLDLTDYRELPRRFGTNHVLFAFREGKLVVNRSGRKLTLA